jgi:hypothetical protein
MEAWSMKTIIAAIFASLVSLEAIGESACPRTTAQDPLFGADIPGWYGTNALAVSLPESGKWPTTRPGMSIGEKVFWRSSGFRPGTESKLRIEIRSLGDGPVTGTISKATNAYLRTDVGGRTNEEDPSAIVQELVTAAHGWFMLTGIDFPEPGCWEISAEYLGQKLTFVVETVHTDIEANDVE